MGSPIDNLPTLNTELWRIGPSGAIYPWGIMLADSDFTSVLGVWIPEHCVGLLAVGASVSLIEGILSF